MSDYKFKSKDYVKGINHSGVKSGIKSYSLNVEKLMKYPGNMVRCTEHRDIMTQTNTQNQQAVNI